MKERFGRTEDVAAGFRRIAALEFDAALRSTAVGGDDHPALAEAVHAVRKRCKKLRALLRLVRGAFGGYSEEQRQLRETARALSHLRDDEARLEAMQRMVRRHPGRLDITLLESARVSAGGGAAPNRNAVLRTALQAAEASLASQRERVEQWRLSSEDFAALEHGLGRTYRDGRTAFRALGDRPTADAMHQLRKAVKYQRHQLAMLAGSWPGPLKAWAHEAELLGERLGEHHDIAVLREHLAGAGLEASARGAFAAAAASDLRRLELDSRRLAARLFAEPRSAVIRRLRLYWTIWRA